MLFQDAIYADRQTAAEGDAILRQGGVEISEILPHRAVVQVASAPSQRTKVTFKWSGKDHHITFACSCGDYVEEVSCSHAWAAAGALDQARLFALAADQALPTKSPSWRNQLRSRRHYYRQRSRQEATDSAASRRSIHYLLDVSALGNWPTVVPYCCLQGNDGTSFYFPLDLADPDFSTSPEDVDRLARGLLLANRANPLDDVKRERKKRKNDTENSEPTPIKLTIGLDSPLLSILCETGRFRWFELTHEQPRQSRPISWDKGRPWKFRIRVEPPKGKRPWRLHGELYRGRQVESLAHAVRCYSSGFVLLGDTLSRLEPPEDFCWVESLAKHGGQLEVPAADRKVLLDELWRTGQPPELIGDKTLELSCEVGTPRGSLAVERLEAPDPGRRRSRDCEAELSFLYNEKRLFPGEGRECWSSEDGTQIICRDREAEAALIDRLGPYFSFLYAGPELHKSPSGETVIQSRERDSCIRQMVGAGWEVFDDTQQVRLLSKAIVEASLTAKSIRVQTSFDFGGVPASLAEVLSGNDGETGGVELSDGSRGLVSEGLGGRLSLLSSIATGRAGKSLNFNADQLLLVDALLLVPEENVQVRRDRTFEKRVQAEASPVTAKPRAAPAQYKGNIPDQLRSQLGGLIRLEELQRSGVVANQGLASRMALVLALLAGRQQRAPQAKSPPPSLLLVEKGNADLWADEAETRIASLTVANYTGTARQEEVGRLADYQLIVTTYDTLSRDIAAFRKLAWDYVVFDAAEKLKDPKSDRNKACKQLKSQQQLILLQAPLKGNILELWPVLELVAPKWLGKVGSLPQVLQVNRRGRQVLTDALLRGLEPRVLAKGGEQGTRGPRRD